MASNSVNYQNEKGLLASIMLADDSSIYDEAITLGITGECFTSSLYRKIFETMGVLAEKNIPISAVELANALPNEPQAHKKLAEICGCVETITHWKAFATAIIVEKQRRDVKRAYELFVENPNNLDHGENLATLETAILTVNRKVSDFPDTAQILNESLEELKKRIASGGRVGIKTGFSFLDALNMQTGNLAVLGGRPATGKTALMLNIVANILAQPKPTPMLIFSLEMTRGELISRLISLIGRVWASALRCGRMTVGDAKKAEQAYAYLMDRRTLFHIIDKADLNYMQMLSYARKFKQRYNIGMVCVDYLQLLKPISRKTSREQEVAEVSRSLKVIAKDLDCVVLALAQLNRQTEQENRPPRASDLRESGAIEQDADYIMILSRVMEEMRINERGEEEKITVYNVPDTETAQSPIIKVNILKNRHGQVGEKNLRFNRQLTKFEEAD